jgi:hypothetical protein
MARLALARSRRRRALPRHPRRVVLAPDVARARERTGSPTGDAPDAAPTRTEGTDRTDGAHGTHRLTSGPRQQDLAARDSSIVSPGSRPSRHAAGAPRRSASGGDQAARPTGPGDPRRARPDPLHPPRQVRSPVDARSRLPEPGSGVLQLPDDQDPDGSENASPAEADEDPQGLNVNRATVVAKLPCFFPLRMACPWKLSLPVPELPPSGSSN